MNYPRKFLLDSNGMPSEEEYKIREAIHRHARERDFQLWLLGGIQISIEEYNRRLALVEAVRWRRF
jgi:hypothetical protein